VQFADMVELGRNPACIIPAWRDFVAPHLDAGRQPRGIGEPVWAERTPEELVEAQLHESLLDEAFADDPSWDLLCPYDAATLDDSVLEVARHTHQSAPSQRTATKPGDSSYAFTAPLPPPPDDAMVLAFDRASLDTVRRFVFGWAQHARIADRRAGDLAVAVSEAATNSVLHGGGHGELRAWLQDGQLVCEVRDDGTILDPLVGRSRPTTVQVSGRGLWLVNHLCDLTQVRSGPLGTAVRMSMSRRPPTLRSVIDASAARDP
jgi:anti-sigma regulatory factor (Ser/Thr protein kinase)